MIKRRKCMEQCFELSSRFYCHQLHSAILMSWTAAYKPDLANRLKKNRYRKSIDINRRLLSIDIAILTVTSPIVINVPTRGLLAVETKDSFVLWLAKFKYQKN